MEEGMILELNVFLPRALRHVGTLLFVCAKMGGFMKFSFVSDHVAGL